LKVRQYFIDVRVLQGVVDFEVKDAIYDKIDQTWEVICGFLPTFMSMIKFFYEVIIDSSGWVK